MSFHQQPLEAIQPELFPPAARESPQTVAAEIAELIGRATAEVSDLRLRLALAHVLFGKVIKDLSEPDAADDGEPTAIAPFLGKLRAKIAAPLDRLDKEEQRRFSQALAREIRNALSVWQNQTLLSADPGNPARA